MNWYVKVFKQYFDFSGRARRKEFWMFTLFHFIFLFSAGFIIFSITGDMYKDTETNYVFVFVICTYLLVSIIPSIAVTVRRLHDSGKSGWWYLISIIPYLGWFVLMIFTCLDGDRRPNKWGDNPKGIGNDRMINQIGKE